jgi:hypothetical protein
MVAEDPIDVDDLGGYAIHAADGAIGKVDQHDIATGTSYLLVATGAWIFGKTVLLPATVIERVDHLNQTVYVTCTRDEIKGAPGYRDDQSHRDDLLAYYSSMPPGPAGTI